MQNSVQDTTKLQVDRTDFGPSESRRASIKEVKKRKEGECFLILDPLASRERMKDGKIKRFYTICTSCREAEAQLDETQKENLPKLFL